MVSLNGKIAIITGASRGIGREIVLMLARNGVHMLLCGTDIESLGELKREVERKNVRALVFAGNLAEAGTPEKIIKEADENFGRIDILINNAGVAVPKPFYETTADEWDLHMAVNARAPFLLCREALPYLKLSNGAAIINISSVVGTKGYVNQAAYTASKHALMGFSKVLAQEVQKDGIRVHVISPGGVATDMVTEMRPDIDTEELISPRDIADIAEFLLVHRSNAVIDEIGVHRASNQPWK